MLGKLVVYLTANYKGLTSGFRAARQNTDQTTSKFGELAQSAHDVENSLGQLVPQYQRLTAAVDDLRSSGVLPVEPMIALDTKLGSINNSVGRVNKQTGGFTETLHSSMMAVEDIAEEWEHVNKLVRGGTANLRQFADRAKATNAVNVNAESSRVSLRQVAPPKTNALINVASTLIGVNAVKQFSTSMTVAKRTMVDVYQSATVSARAMDRFRIAMYAPKVNPAYSFLKTGIDEVTTSAAKATEWIRKTADAILSDLPAALSAGVAGLGKIVKGFDDFGLTVNKWISKLQTMGTGMKIFSWFFPNAARKAQVFNAVIKFAQPLLEKFAALIEMGTQYLRDLLNTARDAEQTLTGTFTETASSADLYSTAMWAANVPTRLMKREMEGATRVAKAAKLVWWALSNPVNAVAVAVNHSSKEWQTLQEKLPKLKNSTSLVQTVMGATAATLKQVDSGLQVVKVAAMDAAVEFVRTSPRIVGAVNSTIGRVQSLAKSAKDYAVGFVTSSARVNAAARTTAMVFVALRDGGAKPLAAAVGRAAKAIGNDLVKDLKKAGVDLAAYIKKWEIGTRVHRAVAISAYVSAKGIQTIVAVSKPAIAVMSGLFSSSKSVVKGLTSVGVSAVSTTLKLTGVTAATRAAGSAMSAGFAKVAQGPRLATLAVAGLMGAMVAMGTSTAIATEKNNAVFGTMLHDMGQGAAVVKSIQGTQAAKLFDNEELLTSGRLLFKAGVNTVDLASKTNQFAKIATATSTELGDLTRIYQQGANAGSFGQDKINQYAERGIAIYDGLAAATGKSGAALKEMISSGQIGVVEMDAALAHLTEGHGIYADSLTNMANTTAGKMATMKNNVSQALGQVMGVALEIAAPFLSSLVSISEGFKSTFESFREPIMYGATAVAWFFKNLVSLAEFGLGSMLLAAVSTFNAFSYWFTDTMPAYLVWFADNFVNIFMDIASGTAAVITNLTTNIMNAMDQIWEFIASGGTRGLEFTWTPLLDGFRSTVEKLPEIAERPIGALEQSLQDRMQTLGSSLADDFDQSFATAVATSQPTVDIKPATTSGIGEIDAATTEGVQAIEKAKAAENKALTVRSTEGQQAMADAIRGALGRDDKKEEKVLAKRSVTALEQIRRNTEGPKIRGAEFAPG